MIQRLQAALSRDGLLALGVTTAQLPFLAELLHRQVPMTQDELSKALTIDPAATARTLEQLEKKGLVKRQVNPENRRQKLVTASPRALELEDEFFAILRKASDTLVEGLSDDEKETALTLLDRIMANGMKAKYGKKG
ncbi:MarR family winged helix-turn-helix transcriptional regulator [Desulfoluna limicola]|nr:MarR family transcriptional regulator [Desulfoluna limicola]